MADKLVEAVARGIHEYLCRRDIMQYLDNEEDCDGLARAIIPLVREAERADVVNDLRRFIKSGERIDGISFMRSQLWVLADRYERGEHTQESK